VRHITVSAQMALGRSSGSPALSAAFPIRFSSDQWRTMAEKAISNSGKMGLQRRDRSGI